MHPVSFAFKRGHIRAVVTHRDLLRRFGITPARFDALYILRWKGGVCYQSEIWQELDLHPSTISRMLKSMEQRGLVVRERVYGTLIDAREVTVTLTRKGFDAIVGAITAFLRDDDLRDFYDRMHHKGAEHIKELVAGVRNIGEWLRDFAKHPYPAERPDVAAGKRYDAHVQKTVDREEKRRAAKTEGLRGLAAIAPEDDPSTMDYFFHPKNVALKKNDPAAFDAKLQRDFTNYANCYALAYMNGDTELE